MKLASSVVLLLLLIQSHAAQAQSMNAPDSPCRKAVVTPDLVQCLTQALNSAEPKLNSTYANVHALLSPEDAKMLAQSQRYWTQSRDAACKTEYSLYGHGTGGPPTHLACLESETRAREASLQRSFGWLVEKFGK